MGRWISIVGGLVATTLLAAPAHAAIVRLEFSGHLQTGFSTIPDPSRPYAGFLTYDTEAPLSPCSVCQADEQQAYGPAGHLEVTYDGVFFATDELPISVSNRPSGDRLFFGDLNGVYLSFFDPTAVALADVSLPAVIPTNLGSWNFGVAPQGSRDRIVFDAYTQVTQVFSDPVPEPGAWALMLLGFGLVGGLARGRRRAPLPLPK